VTDQEIIALAKKDLAGAGEVAALLYMGPDEQPPMEPKSWDEWRRMPQTRRLLSWIVEQLASRRVARVGEDQSDAELLKALSRARVLEFGDRVVEAILTSYGPAKKAGE